MKKAEKPTAGMLDSIRNRFRYDPINGLYESGVRVTSEKVRIHGERVRTKCIAWYLHTGEWPEAVRAIDGDQTNLGITNLSTQGTNGPLRKNEGAGSTESRPLVSLTYSDGVWKLTGPGVKAQFKRFKSAMSALTDLYYTCAKLEDKPM